MAQSLRDSIDDILNDVWRSSCRVYVMATGCCKTEIESLRSSVHAWQRLGVVEVSEPESADVLLAAGWINSHYEAVVKDAFSRLGQPRRVIAAGVCALSGAAYLADSNYKPLGQIIPVDFSVPGCPPRPEALLDAFVQMSKRDFVVKNKNEVLRKVMKVQS